MSSDESKMEKKRLKAQLKAEKARAKAGQPPDDISPGPTEKIPWHRDPNWVRAIVAIATLVVMIVTLLVTLFL